MFRLEAVAVTLPKWGRACGWTPHDDAMLLLGIYWCASLSKPIDNELGWTGIKVGGV